MTKIAVKIIILIFILFPILAWGARKTMTTYTWDTAINVQPTENITTSLPNANSQVLAASGSDIISALNTSGITNYIGAENYWDSKCDWSPWSVIQNLPLVSDPENSGCKIRSQIIPLKTSSTSLLRSTWQTYGAVNYDVQVKLSWFYDLVYAASGVNIRWRESAQAGKYEGYGVSFLNYKSRTSCTADTMDYIPGSIKPSSSSALNDTLLMVLWQQKVTGGIEKRNWLAYAVMNDTKIKGGQSTYESKSMTDNVTVVVRVEDMKSGSQRYSDIKLYYGDASVSSGSRTFDAIASNLNRGLYPPKCSNSSIFPKWPSNTLESYGSDDSTAYYWSYPRWYGGIPYITGNIVTPVSRLAADNFPHVYRCTTAGTTASTQPAWPTASGATIGDGSVTWKEYGTSRPTTYDYYTLILADPKDAASTVKLVINPDLVNDTKQNNNPTATAALQSDRATIRTTDFTLTDYPSAMPEIAIHGMGYLTGSTGWFLLNISRGVAFTDLAIQILGKRE